MPTVLTHICDFCSERAVSALSVRVSHGQNRGTTRALLVCEDHCRWLTAELGEAPSTGNRYDFKGRVTHNGNGKAKHRAEPVPLVDIARTIFDTFEEDDYGYTPKEVTARSGLLAHQVSRGLKYLLDAGFIRKVGKQRAARYYRESGEKVAEAFHRAQYPDRAPSPSVTSDAEEAGSDSESGAYESHVGGVRA